MRTIALLFILALTSLGLSAQTAVKINDCGLDNMYRIDKDVYRSEQPDKEQFKQLASFGIVDVLSLRHWHSDNDEARGTQLRLYRVQMNAHHIKDEDIINALRIIKNRKGNILIHCRHGSDRTGIVVAMYRMVFQHWGRQQAIDEMQLPQFGFHSIYDNIIEYLQNVDIDAIKRAI